MTSTYPRYGTECPICSVKNPSGQYQSHESKYVICGAHTREEISDWKCQPYSGIQSGAPLQPGATQPEHDGVAHETEPLDPFKALELICGNRTGTCNLPVNHKGRCIDERLTTLLERMARLVVEEAAKVPSYQVEYLKGQTGEPAASLRSILQNVEIQIRSLLTEARLQQLREAVERP